MAAWVGVVVAEAGMDARVKIWTHDELDGLVVEIIRISPEGRARKADVIEGFRKAGAPTQSDGPVKAALQRCVLAGKLTQPQRGIYDYIGMKR